MNTAEIMFPNESLTQMRDAKRMDMSVSLQATLLRHTAVAAERAAATRHDQRREAAARAPVEHGEARSQKEDDKTAEAVDPAATYDKLREFDVRHLLDIVA